MVRSYEELLGGHGKAVTFRAERHLVRDFLKRHAARVEIGEESIPLHDISMNGMSFFAPRDAVSVEPRMELEIEVFVGEESVHRGRARIARVEHQGRRSRVGMQLTEGFLDLPEIQRRFYEQELRRELDGGPEAISEAVPEPYQRVCGRIAHFLQHYRRVLDTYEERRRESGMVASDVLEELGERAADAIRARWNELRLEAAEAALPCLSDRAARSAAKRYTETVITPLLLEAPIVHRTYHKPLGYAGDYQSMLQICRNRLEGPTIFGRVFHKLSVEEPLAAGVRTRKDLLEELTRREYSRSLEARGSKETFRVTSLGSGPALEVSQLLDTISGLPAPVHWSLIDQEEEALSLAYDSIHRRIAQTGFSATLQCIYMSFAQFLADSSARIVDEPQHMIYASGLFDYLREPTAQGLVKGLYERLAPGGVMAIGNALWPNDHFWYGEFVLDWTLLYREEAQMRALADLLPDDVELDVIKEPSGAYYFLLVRRS